MRLLVRKRSREDGDHRRMVRGLLPFAWRTVDEAGRATLCQRIRQEDVIDPQAHVASEGELPVVPPAVRFFGLVEKTERIYQVEVHQAPEMLAFGFRGQYMVSPYFGIVDVTVFGSDVVVPEQGQFPVGIHFIGNPVVQRIEPLQLIAELVGIDRLAVRYIDANDAHAGDGGADDALLFVGMAGIAPDDVLYRLPGKDGDAVIGSLSGKSGLIPGRPEFLDGEFVVRQLRLLQAQDVDWVVRQPLQHVGQANPEGVYIPGGDFHVLPAISSIC